jgi:tRNA (guanine-N7-)-methyltransferase
MDKRTLGRHIRSYVLRQGHMTDAQRRASEEFLPKLGIPYQSTPLDLQTVFGRSAPRVVEIGFGMGAATAEIAERSPGQDFLGVEVHGPGVGSLLKLVGEKGLTNIRVVQHDAVEVVRDMLAPGSLDGIHVFFPDPWPKKRHHKRRLLQPPFVALLAERLRPGGYLHAATDWEEYAQQILAVFSAEPRLRNLHPATGYAPRPEYRPLTKFEQRGLNLGHGVWDIIFART